MKDRRQYRHVEYGRNRVVEQHVTCGSALSGMRRFTSLHAAASGLCRSPRASYQKRWTELGGYRSDLTWDDESRQMLSGGLTGDNIGVEYAGTVFGITESPIEAGMIWAGTNDGKLHLTRDGGSTWASH